MAQLTYSPSYATLSWGYVNPGDYNQDGEVGIGDLTPLGQHFGEVSPAGLGHAFPMDSLGGVIDGDGNGVIGISDVTPIGANFGSRVEGYRVYLSGNEDAHPSTPGGANGSGTTWLDSLAFGAAFPTGGRKRFSLQVTPTQDTQYYWVRPFDGAQDGAASNAVSIALPPKQPPQAQIFPSGQTATLAHIVWDASGSRDPDGVIVKYEWDFDNDGVYEYDGGAAGGANGGAKQDFYYYDAGDYTVSVRVTDSDGLSATATTPVTITQQQTWHATIVDERVNYDSILGGFADGMLHPAALLDVGGNPAIFYQRLRASSDSSKPPHDLCYIRAQDAFGESWGEPVALGEVNYGAGAGTLSFFGAATKVAERPAAAYTYQTTDENGSFVTNTTLFVRASDALGAGWPTPKDIFVSVDASFAFAPRQLSLLGDKLAVIGGYANFSGGFLLNYMVSNDASGSIWAEPSTTPISLNPATADTAVVDNLLASARFENSQDLLYYRAQDTAAFAWGEPVLVDQLEKVGGRPDLTNVDGFPAVVYYDDALGGLKYRWALDLEGTLWSQMVVLSAQAEGSHLTAVIDGRPSVLFGDRIDGRTKMVCANGSSGGVWGFASQIIVGSSLSLPETNNYYIPYVSFAEIGSLPAIAHIVPFTNDVGDAGYRLEYVAYY